MAVAAGSNSSTVTTKAVSYTHLFLTYRIIADMERCFAPGVEPRRFPFPEKRLPVRDSQTLLAELERATREACKDGKAALALSLIHIFATRRV